MVPMSFDIQHQQALSRLIQIVVQQHPSLLILALDHADPLLILLALVESPADPLR